MTLLYVCPKHESSLEHGRTSWRILDLTNETHITCRCGSKLRLAKLHTRKQIEKAHAEYIAMRDVYVIESAKAQRGERKPLMPDECALLVRTVSLEEAIRDGAWERKPGNLYQDRPEHPYVGDAGDVQLRYVRADDVLSAESTEFFAGIDEMMARQELRNTFRETYGSFCATAKQ